MSSIANLTWTPVPGSTSTLVEYKAATDTDWTVATGAGDNPTIYNTYSITLQDGVQYYYRLTTNGIRCAPTSITGPMKNGSSLCCPTGYTLSADGSYCQQVNITPATAPTNSENTIASPYFNYGAYGSLIYNAGYNLNGVGNYVKIPSSNTFWINFNQSTTSGPNNRTALWAPGTPGAGQQVGFTVCINAPTAGTYYIGCFADNYVQISVDGVDKVVMDKTAMGNAFQATYPGIGDSCTFYFWHIYPVVLTSGSHIINIIGHNDGGPAGFGTEIYNATSTDLQGAVSYSNLGSKLIFSTKDYIGQPIQIGTGGLGYTCATGGLVLCDGSPYCKQVLTTALISC